MCRLAFFAGKDEGRDQKVLIKTFKDLDARQGGDGMGVALLRDHASVVIEKGVAMSPERCARLVATRAADETAMWHCRKSTTGKPVDAACHPFYISAAHTNRSGWEHEVVLVHNGIISDWERYCTILFRKGRTYNDSMLLTYLMAMRGRHVVKNLLGSGAVISAERLVNQEKKQSTRWRYQCIRVSSGDLRSMPYGGVISTRFDDLVTSDTEVVGNKWHRIFTGKMVPVNAERKYLHTAHEYETAWCQWYGSEGTPDWAAEKRYVAARAKSQALPASPPYAPQPSTFLVETEINDALGAVVGHSTQNLTVTISERQQTVGGSSDTCWDMRMSMPGYVDLVVTFCNKKAMWKVWHNLESRRPSQRLALLRVLRDMARTEVESNPTDHVLTPTDRVLWRTLGNKK